MRQGYTRASLPEFHDNKLIVRLQSKLDQSVRIGLAMRGGRQPQLELPVGLSAIAKFERQGQIKRVTPLDRNAPTYDRTNRIEPLTFGRDSGLRVAGARRRRASSAGMPVDGVVDVTAPALELDYLHKNLDLGVEGPARAARTMLDSALSSTVGGLKGASIIELENGSDLEELRRALSEDPTVSSVSRVPIRYLMAKKAKRATSPKRSPAGPARAAPQVSAMWNLDRIGWQAARNKQGFVDATRIKVAVLDTGIDAQHPDLKGLVKSYTYEHPDLPGASGSKDFVGHGTHVAGTIAARIGNSVGVNGVCACQLHVWKIFADNPTLFELDAEYAYVVDDAMYLRALIDAFDQEMDVVNLSIGGPGRPSAVERDAFADLDEGGVTVVAAMGNERRDGSPISYPAAIRSVIAVGATTLADRVAQFSNSGNHIAVCAPGDKIWSTLPTYAGQDGWTAIRDQNGGWMQGKPFKRETDYDAWSGTSMATPHVSAAAALYLAKKGKVGPAGVREALAATSDKVSGMNGKNFHPDYGYGRINLERLL